MSKPFKHKRRLGVASFPSRIESISIDGNHPLDHRDSSHLEYYSYELVWRGEKMDLWVTYSSPEVLPDIFEFAPQTYQPVRVYAAVTIQANRRTGEVFEVWN